MANNINYIIEESEHPTDNLAKTDFEIKLYEMDLYYTENNLKTDYTFEELYMLYTSYNVKSLTQIMNYYGLTTQNINNKKKLVKDELIQLLILFELEAANKPLVIKRQRLWQNIAELIAEPFFKSFIMFTV